MKLMKKPQDLETNLISEEHLNKLIFIAKISNSKGFLNQF